MVSDKSPRPDVSAGAPLFPEPLHVGRPNIGDRAAFLRLMGEIFDRRWLSNDGPVLKEFEAALAERMGVRHVIAMCNGTLALEIAAKAMGLTGEVIVPSYTFVATAHALEWMGLTPVFADVDPETHALDPDAVRRVITPRTSAILAVHLWGRAAPVEELQSLADEFGLQLFFDAAHAFGCSYREQPIGGFGRCEMLSFHATKFFNSFEGGALTTNDDELAARVRLMRNFGFTGLDRVESIGTNAKMIEPAAAMGLVNLRALDEVVATNRRNYLAYQRSFANQPGLALLPYDEREANNFQYVVLRVRPEFGVSRDALVEELHRNNILARKYFWPGCHRMSPYRERWPELGQRLPNTETVAGEVVVLPTGTAVSEADIEVIGDLIVQTGAKSRLAAKLAAKLAGARA